jgi:hypothetical protein
MSEEGGANSCIYLFSLRDVSIAIIRLSDRRTGSEARFDKRDVV